MYKLPIAEDSLVYIPALLIPAIMFYFIYFPVSLIFIALLSIILFFFRNPSRTIPHGENLILSPADGRIMSVGVIDEPLIGQHTKAIKISIFLSVFNVHINRSPIEGTVKYVHYKPGLFLPAFKSHASGLNERNSIIIEGKFVRVLVHQITGFIARRIVCRAKTGSCLRAGESFGLIKFGSCTEIVFPENAEVRVKAGDKVKGGISVLGVVKSV